MAHGLTAGILRCHLGGVGGAFSGALKATLACTGPSDDGAPKVGDADDRIVEARLNMGDTLYDVLAAFGLDDFDRLDGVIQRNANRRRSRCGCFFCAASFFPLGSRFGFWSFLRGSLCSCSGCIGDCGDRSRRLDGYGRSFGGWGGCLNDYCGSCWSTLERSLGWFCVFFTHTSVKCGIRLCRLWRLCCAERPRFCVVPCGCGHWWMCAGHGREGHGDDGCHGSS